MGMQNKRRIEFSKRELALVIILIIVYGILHAASFKLMEILPGERQIEKSTLPLTYKWSYTVPTQIRDHPLIVAGLVILRTDDSVIALKSETGEQVWMVPAPSFLGPFPVIAIQGNTILVASDRDSKVKSINGQNGSVLWEQEPDGLLGHTRVVATDNQRVYVGLNRADLPIKAYHLQSGAQIWVNDPQIPWGYSAAVLKVNENEVYALIGGDLYILDAETGTLKKSIPQFDQGSDVQFVNQVALTWFNSTLLVKDVKTGNRVWQFNKRPNFFNVIGDRVYVSSDCCALHALEFSTGQLVWERPLPLLTASEVVTVGDIGYVMLKDGSILAFDAATGADRGKLETMPRSVGINVPDRGLGTDGTSLYATFGQNKVFAFGP